MRYPHKVVRFWLPVVRCSPDQRSTIHDQQLTSLLLLCLVFYPAMPYHETCSWINQNVSYNLLGGPLAGNGFLNEPGMHFLVTDPKLHNRRLLLKLLFYQHTLQPLLHAFFAWLQLIFLPCYLLFVICYLLFVNRYIRITFNC